VDRPERLEDIRPQGLARENRPLGDFSQRREPSGRAVVGQPATPTALSADAGSSAGTGRRRSSGASTPYSLAPLSPQILFLPSSPSRAKAHKSASSGLA